MPLESATAIPRGTTAAASGLRTTPLAVTNIDDTEHREAIHCLANRRAPYPERNHQLPFRRHPGARLEAVTANLADELLGDIGSQLVPRDR